MQRALHSLCYHPQESIIMKIQLVNNFILRVKRVYALANSIQAELAKVGAIGTVNNSVLTHTLIN